MANENLAIDGNWRNVTGGVTDDASEETRVFRVDPSTNRLKTTTTVSGTPGMKISDVDTGGTQTNDLIVSLDGETITVTATDLDIRDLTSASDSVEVVQGTAADLKATVTQAGNIDVGDISAGTQTNDVKITLDGESVAVTNTGLSELASAINASNQMDVNIAADGSGGVEVVQATAADLNITEANSGSIKTAVELIDDSIATISTTDVQRVAIFDDSDSQITSFGGGTQYTEDDAAPANPVGTAMMMERDNALGGLTPAEGDWTHPFANANGALWVKHDGDVSIADGGNTITVDGTVSANSTLQTGSNTVGKVYLTDGTEDAAVNASNELQVRDDDANTDLDTIVGAISGSEMQVDVVASLPAGTNNIGEVDVSSPSTVVNGQKTVTSAGTAEALGSTTTIKSVTIKALEANTGNVYVGDSSVASTNGLVLTAGEAVSLDIDNLDAVYIDVDTNGEGVSYLGVN